MSLYRPPNEGHEFQEWREFGAMDMKLQRDVALRGSFRFTRNPMDLGLAIFECWKNKSAVGEEMPYKMSPRVVGTDSILPFPLAPDVCRGFPDFPQKPFGGLE